MSSNKSKRKSNTRNKSYNRKNERFKYTEDEDSELDELEKIIADSENAVTNDEESSTEEEHDINEEINENINEGNDDAGEENEDFFASLDKEELQTFRHRKEKEGGNVSGIDKILKFVKGNTRYAIWGSVVAVLFIALIIALAVDAGNKGSGSKDEVKKKQENTLNANADKEIETLVNDYFSAIVSCDVNKLSEIMDSTGSISEDNLKKESEYIEEYKNIKCYTKNGINSGEYVVYVYYENKILNINTLAPGAVILYVKKDEEKGIYRIHNGINDTEISNYISKLSEDEDVIKFNKDVDNKFKEACENDADLKAFYDALISASQDKQEDSSESTQQETQPQETQPQETPAP